MPLEIFEQNLKFIIKIAGRVYEIFRMTLME